MALNALNVHEQPLSLVCTHGNEDLDPIDHQIIELLSHNARRTMADIGEQVSLSASAVTRRIERLERTGVIAGYTVVVDHRKAGRPIQAFTEVRFAGTADLQEIKETAMQLSEVQAVFTTAGDPDALVWLQVPDVERLGQVIEQLRRRGRVTGTKTLIVLDTWSRHRALEANGSASTLVRRAGPITAALAALALSLARGRCGQSRSAGLDERRTDHHPHHRGHHHDHDGPAGTWSKAISGRRRANLSVVSCAAPAICLIGIGHRARPTACASPRSPRLALPVPSPSPQGVAYVSAPAPGFAPPRPTSTRWRFLSGASVAGPGHHPRRPGHHGHRLHRPTFCITIDGEGNSFAYDGSGWSGNLGAWGAANQISCTSPVLLRGAEGGPSVCNGDRGPSPAKPTARASSTPSRVPRPRSACWSTAAEPS